MRQQRQALRKRVMLPDGRPGMVCHFYDLSERQRHEAEQKRAAEELRQTHDRLQSVLASIIDGLLILDKEWRCTYFSERGARIIGMRPDQVIGKVV